MIVILNKDLPNLGEEGDVKEVANGYARNYLIPKRLAVPYTKHFVNLFDGKKNRIEKRKAEKKSASVSMKTKIEAESLTLFMPSGENGKLFGAVTSSMVAEEMEKKGFSMEKKDILIPGRQIKATGNYNVAIKLYGQEATTLRLVVKPLKNSNEETEPEEVTPTNATSPETQE